MAEFPNLALVASFFPDFEKWLERAGNPTRYMQEAEGELEKLPRAAIERACKAVLKDEHPRASKVPFEVAKLARRIAASMEAMRWQRIAGTDDSVKCPVCRDTGYVDILHPQTVVQVLKTRMLPSFPYTAVVACNCLKGQAVLDADRRAEPRFKRGLVAYDARRHVLREVGVLPMDQYRALLEGSRARWSGDPSRAAKDVEIIVEELAESIRIQEDV